MYIFKNSKLQEDFPFLIHEADKLHPNDPNRSSLIGIAQDLLFLDKQATLEFISSIKDSTMMFYAISSSCWVRFPTKTFMETLKRQIDRFKDNGNYELLMMWYHQGLKYLEDLETDKINTRAYQAELKKNK
jgi:hypothetical protein